MDIDTDAVRIGIAVVGVARVNIGCLLGVGYRIRRIIACGIIVGVLVA